ncbi:MAG: hypothetical protein R6U56_08455 [Opitutales bacterium]
MDRIFLFSALVAAATSAMAQPAGVRDGPWRTLFQGAAAHQLDSDLDGGGSYSVTRATIEAGLAYGFGPRDSFGLSFGYSRDDYSFDGTTGLAGRDPWDSLHEYRVSAPLRKGFGERIDAFALPSLRWTAESGGDLSEAMAGGLIAGANYRVNDRLRIGPGIGVFGEIEDDVSIFPILFIDWQITDTISLETGRGIGATRGPGLQLNATGIEDWTFGIGARYDTFRFRLDDESAVPDGVGEEKVVSLFFAATYDATPNMRLSAVAGLEVGGELTLEDKDGREIQSDDADPAPFVGFAFRTRF